MESYLIQVYRCLAIWIFCINLNVYSESVFAEFLMAMGNDSLREQLENQNRLVMSDVVELDYSCGNPASVDECIERRDICPVNNLVSFATHNQISSAKFSKSILERNDPEPVTHARSTVHNLPLRPKMMPSILKRGRSMPFIDPNDQILLSPINESPQRSGQQKFFPAPVGDGSQHKSSRSTKSFSGIGSPRGSAVHCTYELAYSTVDDLPCEKLTSCGMSHPARKLPSSLMPELLTSTSHKVTNTLFILPSPIHSSAIIEADSVLDFEPPPMLKHAKKWASEGNILKFCPSETKDPPQDEEDMKHRVVNGSPDVVRAQKKIEYIVEAVNEVGQSSGVLQTPRLALSRHNSHVDPKMLESPRDSNRECDVDSVISDGVK